MPLIKEAIANGERFWAHAFEYTCGTTAHDWRMTHGHVKTAAGW
ncbi:hypothetical protein [Rhizobium leguminosarum]|nr:hypothetical protein [Rhizobium leguminosarum]